MKIELIGTFLGFSGYDSHIRAFIRELRKQGILLRATNFEGWSAPVVNKKDVSDITSHADQSLTQFDITLHCTMPQQSSPKKGTVNICFTMFEADRISDTFLEHSLKYELIVVPTKSSANAWIKTGFPIDKIRICPLGVDTEIFYSSDKNIVTEKIKNYQFDKYKHIFLNIADLRPRKNHLGLIRSWLNATSAMDDAVLILKIFPLDPETKWLFESDLKRISYNMGKDYADAAKIILISDFLEENDIRSLYNISTHYISMSHGEGWDLPLTEAMASGLHIIAPYHSAYESYLSDKVATLIPSHTTAANAEASYRKCDHIWFKNARWWNPDEENARSIIRGVLDRSLPAIDNGADYAKSNLSWEKATSRLIEIFKEAQT